MALKSFDIPLDFKPLVTNNPHSWINKLMALERRKDGRQVGLHTLPYVIRMMLTDSVWIKADEVLQPDECTLADVDTWFPNPKKIARCLISKPTICQMGEEEEKVYCGMQYGPDYSSNKQKLEKKLEKMIKKLMIMYIPKIDEILQKSKKENMTAIKKYFQKALDEKKAAIIKKKKDELMEKERELTDSINIKRSKALLALQGKMENEIKEVNKCKKDYLKDRYEFQMNWLLKNKEQQYLRRMNIYSSIWNKILYNLEENAKQRISKLNQRVDRLIDDIALKDIKDKLEVENKQVIMKFYDEIQITTKCLRAKVVAEEFHIQKEKEKEQQIKNRVKIWNSLLEHIIKLFDKIIVASFKGVPGQCNYFLSEAIIEKLKKLNEKIDNASKNTDYESGNESSKNIIDKLRSQSLRQEFKRSKEQMSVQITPDKSYFTIDMTLEPPDKDLIIELNIFQVKKLIEETTCTIMTKPLQIAEFMKDEFVELKPFCEGFDEESTYLLDKLSKAYQIFEKMLMDHKTKKGIPVHLKNPVKVPYTIETDPEIEKRINLLIKAYRRNPDHIKALTNV